MTGFVLFILNFNLYYPNNLKFHIPFPRVWKFRSVLFIYLFFLTQLFGFAQSFFLIIVNLLCRPNLKKLHYKIVTVFVCYLLYLTVSASHMLYLIFFLNLLMLNSSVDDSRLYLGEAFKLIGEAVKGNLAKMGLPLDGLGGFIGIGAGVITADQWSKERKLSQINNNISALDRRVQDFRYFHPDATKLTPAEKSQLQAWQAEIQENHAKYRSTGGVFYDEICTMHEKFTDKFS